ncbi:MAG: type Z 30S ribosomal protein S14 [Candidatus Gracilibacteria bacterium]|nr:type Z 30S ribosomal protein S14 [Candidatus Gracilibacteria bacterium]
MAKTSQIVKCAKRQKKLANALKDGRKPKFPTRVYNRCHCCGRPRGFIRKFGLCRICIRQFAADDMIMGLRKASW